MRRRLRPTVPGPRLRGAHLELLRVVERQPGIGVAAAARVLHLAANSVSTLVKQLTRAGLIQRSSDPLDGRAACLWLTPLSQDWVARVGSAREAAIARALEALDESERAALQAAVPAMIHLSKSIAARGSAAQ